MSDDTAIREFPVARAIDGVLSPRWKALRGLWASFANGEAFIGIHVPGDVRGLYDRAGAND